MNTQKKSCGRYGLIVRSIQPNRAVVAAQRAVVFFALTCQCEDIVRSLSEKTKYKGKHLC